MKMTLDEIVKKTICDLYCNIDSREHIPPCSYSGSCIGMKKFKQQIQTWALERVVIDKEVISKVLKESFERDKVVTYCRIYADGLTETIFNRHPIKLKEE